MTDASPQAAEPEPLPPHPPLTRYYADEAEHRRQMGKWFDEAAPDYNWINQAMSFGSGNHYRKEALLRAGLAPGMSLLDTGCGTGIVAVQGQEIVGPAGKVVGLDPSLGMLREAGRRGARRRVRALAEALPFPDQVFDRLSMGYALRHVADLRTTFQEYRRVLKDGGKVLLLEITPPRSRFATVFLKLYMGGVLPFLARFGRGGRSSQTLMEYYWDTIENCVPPDVILGALKDAGFSQVERLVQMGMLSEYTAVR
ncbi:MAG TPA: class I SAM-dependent methyltransferase [Thermoanaerobaculia bacterium]|nr:class I SAM-dependent methyltransferase [Thermoanaerobaculia bacterium]